LLHFYKNSILKAKSPFLPVSFAKKYNFLIEKISKIITLTPDPQRGGPGHALHAHGDAPADAREHVVVDGHDAAAPGIDFNKLDFGPELIG
jgi:hypothetical protein